MQTAPELIREARRRATLSQAELARRAGIPRSVLNAYERGTRQPRADALVAVLAAAGFELRLAQRIDLERNARTLNDVVELAEALPYRPEPDLRYPPLHRRVG